MKQQNIGTTIGALFLVALMLGCSDNDPNKKLAAAKAHLQAKDSRSAVIEIKNALQLNPELAEARFMLGTVLMQQGEAEAAEIELRKALAAQHPKELVVPALAEAMLSNGLAKKLVDEFAQTRLGPAAADASLQTSLATAYDALGKKDAAAAALKSALAANPDHVPALLARARQKALAGDFDGALQTCELVLTKDTGNAGAWQLKGDILQQGKGDAVGALAAYRKAVEIDPRFVPGHLAVLKLLLRQQKFEEAGAQLQALKQFDAKNPQTLYFEAQLAYLQQDYPRANELAQQLLAAWPGNPAVLELAGAVAFRMNALPQAEVHLLGAVQAAPDLALARRLLVATYLRSGQSVKALAAVKAAEGKDGLEPGLLVFAGQAHLQTGDAKRAAEYFAEALKLDPDNARKRTVLAITQVAIGSTQLGFDELQTVAGADSGTAADLALIAAHMQRREFDAALTAAKRMEAKQPDKPLAAELRGRILLGKGDRAAARQSFERALQIDPSYFAAVAGLAAMDMADNNPQVARQRFDNMLARDPKNARALWAQAELAAAQGSPAAEVAAWLDRAIDANPADAAPRLQLIELWLKAGDDKRALSAAQAGVGAIPSSVELLDALGRVQQRSGDLNQAVATFAKVVALSPQAVQSHLRLADAQMAAGNSRGAEQSVRKALELAPEDLQAQRSLIILQVQAKNYPAALAGARNLQKQRPKEAVGYVVEGDVLALSNDIKGALAAYQAGLRLAPAAALATKAHVAMLKLGQTKEAERFAATWAKSNPKDVVFLAHIGDSALRGKDYGSAEKAYLALVRAQPNSALGLNNLAWVTHQLRKPGAMAYAEKANRIAPNQPPFMDTLAMLMSGQGEHARAIDLQSKVVAAQPKNTAYRLNLAKIYIAAGDTALAKTELAKVTDLGEKASGYAEAVSLLKTL